MSEPTRLNPPAILDKIITSLNTHYQIPEIQPPLDSDPDKNGKASDHKIVVMKPISVINNISARTTKEIIFRPLKEAGMQQMQDWLHEGELFKETHGNVHEIAKHFMETLKEKTDKFFPEQKRKISSDNQPFFSENLAILKRKKQREYNKNRQSEKWIKLNHEYNEKLGISKKMYYKKEIAKLKKSNPKKWFYWLKRLVSKDQSKEKELIVDEISNLPIKQQAEVIADAFSSVSQEYEEIQAKDIKIPYFSPEDIPIISVKTVEKF